MNVLSQSKRTLGTIFAISRRLALRSDEFIRAPRLDKHNLSHLAFRANFAFGPSFRTTRICAPFALFLRHRALRTRNADPFSGPRDSDEYFFDRGRRLP